MPIEERVARGRRVGPALDLHMQRQTNAADAKDGGDLVTLRQLEAMLKGLTIGGGSGTSVTTNVTNNNTYNNTGPFHDCGIQSTQTFDIADGYRFIVSITGASFVGTMSGFSDGDIVIIWYQSDSGNGGESIAFSGGTGVYSKTTGIPTYPGASIIATYIHTGTEFYEISSVSYPV